MFFGGLGRGLWVANKSSKQTQARIQIEHGKACKQQYLIQYHRRNLACFDLIFDDLDRRIDKRKRQVQMRMHENRCKSITVVVLSLILTNQLEKSPTCLIQSNTVVLCFTSNHWSVLPIDWWIFGNVPRWCSTDYISVDIATATCYFYSMSVNSYWGGARKSFFTISSHLTQTSTSYISATLLPPRCSSFSWNLLNKILIKETTTSLLLWRLVLFHPPIPDQEVTLGEHKLLQLYFVGILYWNLKSWLQQTWTHKTDYTKW